MARRAGDPLNLTGLWRGQYDYPIRRQPVSFTAAITETGAWITGTTEEIATGYEARGRVLTATLQGRRLGGAVKFLKLYDAAMRSYDAVAYEGRLSPDGREIDGRWTIPGNWSGTFLMVRAGEAEVEEALEAEAKG